MIHLYTSRQYGKKADRDRPWMQSADEFRLLCTKEWMTETEYVAKGPYRMQRPKSVTSVRKHVTCPKCLDILLPQAIAEVEEMKAAYEKNSGKPFGQRTYEEQSPTA